MPAPVLLLRILLIYDAGTLQSPIYGSCKRAAFSAGPCFYFCLLLEVLELIGLMGFIGLLDL